MPFTALHEPRLGLSHARNRGVAAARGAVIAFTDDDVSVAPDWIVMLERVFADQAVAAAGGRILPEAGLPLPAWLTPDLRYHFALLDHGEAPRRMATADLWGANIAFRAEVFDHHGGFDPALGRCGGKLFLGEETALLDRLLRAGEVVLYDPRLVVEHRLPPERLRQEWVCRRMADLGELEQRRAGCAYRSLCGVPFWVANETLRKALALLHPGRGEAERFRLRLRRDFCLGYARAGWRAWRAARTREGAA